MEMWIAKGFGGERKASKKPQDKPTMEKRIAKGIGLKSDEVCERKAPKKLQDKPAMEKKTAKGIG